MYLFIYFIRGVVVWWHALCVGDGTVGWRLQAAAGGRRSVGASPPLLSPRATTSHRVSPERLFVESTRLPLALQVAFPRGLC